MNKAKLSLILAVAAAASSAMAATSSFTSPIVPGAFVPATQPGAGGQAPTIDATLTVSQFDASLGTLTGVSYTLTYWSYATYSINNLSGSAGSYDINFRLGRNVTGEKNVLTEPGAFTQEFFGALHSQTVGPVAIGGSLSGTTDHMSDTYSNTATASLATYTGAGTVDFVFNPLGISGITGNSNPTGSENGQPIVEYAAQLGIVYTYTPTGVPEASTYAAGAVVLAGAGMILRRRMVAAK